MKNWIRVIFALNNKFDALTYSIDKQVEGMAALLTVPTVDLFDAIIKLNDKKVRIINLRVLHDKMKESLSAKELYVVDGYARGVSLSEMGERLSLGKGGAYRQLLRTIKKLTKILAYYGYTKERLDEEYKDVALVTRTYKKLVKAA